MGLAEFLQILKYPKAFKQFCWHQVYFFPYLKVITYVLWSSSPPYLKSSICLIIHTLLTAALLRRACNQCNELVYCTYCHPPMSGLQACNKLTHCTDCRPPSLGLQALKSRSGATNFYKLWPPKSEVRDNIFHFSC